MSDRPDKDAASAPRPPLERWLPLVGERWIADLAVERIETGEPWDIAVGAGLLARLGGPEPLPRDVLLRRALAGEVMGIGPAVRGWSRTLPEETLRAIDRFGAIRCEAMIRAAEALVARFDPTDEAWRAHFGAWLNHRDDAECARVVLRAADRHRHLDVDLETVDRKGREAVATFLDVPPLEDARLAAVAVYDPGAWWADPAIVRPPAHGEDASSATVVDLRAPVALRAAPHLPERLAAQPEGPDGSQGEEIARPGAFSVRVFEPQAGEVYLMVLGPGRKAPLHEPDAVALTDVTGGRVRHSVLTRAPALWVARLGQTGRLRLRVRAHVVDLDVGTDA